MAALDGVYEKIERAKVHQADLARRLDAVLGADKQHFVLDGEPDHETGRYAVRVYGVPDIDPGWLTIIGDCLHNLRSALDHLAWQLVLLDGKTPTRETSFPVRTTKDDSRLLLLPQVCRQDILDAVKAVQPYCDSGDDPPVLHPLFAITRLNNIDKHRKLLVAVHTLNLGETHWGWSGDDPKPTFYFHPVAVKEDGTVVASFDFHGRKPPGDFGFTTALHVVVNEEELPNLTLNGAANLLDGFIFHLEHMLIVHFARLFPPGAVRPSMRIRPVRPISP
jgi:hypothetical protein